MAAKQLKRPRDPLQLNKLIGDIATGQIQDKGMRGTYQLSGTITPDGSFSGFFGRGALTGKFSGDRFAGNFPAPEAVCGAGNMQFERAK